MISNEIVINKRNHTLLGRVLFLNHVKSVTIVTFYEIEFIEMMKNRKKDN